jgi:RecQ family ATP-dependent DNA helicase
VEKRNPFWSGLTHQPTALLQSGGFPRFLSIGQLLRQGDALTRRLRRAASQSALYALPDVLHQPGSLPLPQQAVLESLNQILQRSELCPPHPDVEELLKREHLEQICRDVRESIPDSPSALSGKLTVDELRGLLLGWAIPSGEELSSPPIVHFDDEDGGARSERGRWHSIQSTGAGLLRRWAHPQVLFPTLTNQAEPKDQRRVDFCICPPWAEPLVWEVHGEFDTTDRAKDAELRRHRLKTFNDVVGTTSDKERAEALDELCQISGGPIIRSTAFSRLLDSCWVASQVDLALYTALATRTWNQDRPDILVKVPMRFKEIARIATDRFVELVQSLDAAWGVAEHDPLVHDNMTARVCTSGEHSISIDPHATTYIPADSELGSHIVVRRACLPVDVYGLWRPWSTSRQLDGMRPANEPSEVALLPTLRRCFSHKSFRSGQCRGISAAMRGSDSLILLPTGHGKSLIFQLSALLLPGATLVVEAWRALIEDQVRNLQDLGISRTLAIHQDRQLNETTGVRQLIDSLITYVAPERLYVTSFQDPMIELLRSAGLDLLVVDEAHVVSEAGHSFRPSYLGLADRVAEICAKAGRKRPPILALTATAAGIVVQDVRGILRIEDPPITLRDERDGPAFVRHNLRDEILRVPASEGAVGFERSLQKVLRDPRSKGRGIVFCVSKGKWTKSRRPLWFGVQGTVDQIEGAARVTAHYTGGNSMTAESRLLETERFVDGEVEVMVATDAFGAGIDLPDIKWIANLGFPSGLEAYYQQLGRAGRDGSTATGFLIVDEDSNEVVTQLLDARQKSDSFGSLRTVIANQRNNGLGSIARQLGFLVGKEEFKPGELSVTDTPRKKPWLPSFPGWRWEAAAVDRRLLQAVFSAGPRNEFEFHFANDFDSLVWKGVNRLRELRLIAGSYSRTFAQYGTNKFVLTTTELSGSCDPASLEARLRECISRLRGDRKGRDVSRKARDELQNREADLDRAHFACSTLLANTYEAVRESRLGSLDNLRTYARTPDQGKRHQLIEDYFSRDKFIKQLRELCDAEPTPEIWGDALEIASSERPWRIGAFQRLAEDFPGLGLPNFLLLVGLLSDRRLDEVALQMLNVFANDDTPVPTQQWAWETLVSDLDDTVRESAHEMMVRYLDAAGRNDLAARAISDRLAMWMPQRDGESALAHIVVEKCIESPPEDVQ